VILIIGGAGYIGSHVVKQVSEKGFDVIVFDNLSTGHIDAVNSRATFIYGDLLNKEDLTNVFIKYPITTVIQLAACCYVGESVINPSHYYLNNVAGMAILLDAMKKHNIKTLVFSSSCAVYGKASDALITEIAEKKPINPYGCSKLMGEQMIRDCSKAFDLEYIILRFFNVAGADSSGDLGEDHIPETHLIPNVIKSIIDNDEKSVNVLGADYQTRDGTCIRDFIHVEDLANAHFLALLSLINKENLNQIYNVGIGKGYTVKEVIQFCETILTKKANVSYKKRREGDPPILIASNEKIKAELGWYPKYGINEMIQSASNWFQKNPQGYSK
jgi:UDP-glucose 4-epimerase